QSPLGDINEGVAEFTYEVVWADGVTAPVRVLLGTRPIEARDDLYASPGGHVVQFEPEQGVLANDFDPIFHVPAYQSGHAVVGKAPS
ncbi:hypothetical protein, partial [Salmonella sp. SAL4447]|uniref:hypothetical protein n=1 Tax=Salmonella sp. SAL4447 TaxID=3159902 RepID=UPI00397C351F